MNQSPAAILVLAGSVCGHAAAQAGDSWGIVIGLIGVLMGLCGAASLVSACWRLGHFSDEPHSPATGTGALPAEIGTRASTADSGAIRIDSSLPGANRLADQQLSPEISAQLALVAHLRGQERTQIIEELLRRHLPRYTNRPRW